MLHDMHSTIVIVEVVKYNTWKICNWIPTSLMWKQQQQQQDLDSLIYFKSPSMRVT